MNPHRVMCLILPTLAFSMMWTWTLSEEVWQDCYDTVREVIRKPMFGIIGAKLMHDNENNSTGFVYSDAKIFNKLFILLLISSNDTRKNIKQFLGMSNDKRCALGRACSAFEDLMYDISHYRNKVSYKSIVYVFPDLEIESLVFSCTKFKNVKFTLHPSHVLLKINSEYAGHMKFTSSSYLKKHLDPTTDFFLLDTLMMREGFFGDIKLINSDIPFKDYDDKTQEITWVRTTREVWISDTFPPPGRNKYSCEYVRLIRSQLGDENLYMFYVQPVLKGLTPEEKMRCFLRIFANFEEYIKIAQNISSSGKSYHSLAVPLMDVSTEFNLKHVLKRSMPELFEKDQITYLYKGTKHTLNELWTWENYNNKPHSPKVASRESDTKSTVFLDSPFVFTLMEINLNTILKTGVFLR